MDIKNQEQALKLQEEFKARLLQTVETLRQGKAPSPDVMVEDRQKLIARAQARLDDAVKQREAMLQQWDERIARLKEDVQRLQSDASDFNKRLSGQETDKPQRTNSAARKKSKR